MISAVLCNHFNQVTELRFIFRRIEGRNNIEQNARPVALSTFQGYLRTCMADWERYIESAYRYTFYKLLSLIFTRK